MKAIQVMSEPLVAASLIKTSICKGNNEHLINAYCYTDQSKMQVKTQLAKGRCWQEECLRCAKAGFSQEIAAGPGGSISMFFTWKCLDI